MVERKAEQSVQEESYDLQPLLVEQSVFQGLE